MTLERKWVGTDDIRKKAGWTLRQMTLERRSVGTDDVRKKVGWDR